MTDLFLFAIALLLLVQVMHHPLRLSGVGIVLSWFAIAAIVLGPVITIARFVLR